MLFSYAFASCERVGLRSRGISLLFFLMSFCFLPSAS